MPTPSDNDPILQADPDASSNLGELKSNQILRPLYPQAPSDKTIVDDLHGTLVADPFRPLEDAASAKTQSWLDQQAILWEAARSKMPECASILARLTQLSDYPRATPSNEIAGRYFSFENTGLQPFDVFVMRDTPRGSAKVVLDPNALSADGTVSVRSISVSPDAKYAAYMRSDSGSDWAEIRVHSIDTDSDLEDVLLHVKFSSISWDQGAVGIYYSRYDEPDQASALQAKNINHKLYYHKLGTTQDQDVLVYSIPEQPHAIVDGEVSFDNKYLIVSYSEGASDKNAVVVVDRQSGAITPLFVQNDAVYRYLGNDGANFYFQTTKDAPNERIICLPLNAPDPKNWRTLIAESSDRIDSAEIRGKYLVVSKIHNVHSALSIYQLADGTLVHDVTLPGVGTISPISGERDKLEGYFSFTSFQAPASNYHLKIESGEVTLDRATQAPLGDIEIETKQVWFKSKDGTDIPMFIVHKTGIELNGTNPTVLYGYGGFDVSLYPSYSSVVRAFVEAGGVWAQPTLRGGGEFGQAWHEAAMKEKKQNTFDDFIAAAHHLIESGYTTPAHLGISGGSNGGLLVGACMTQRPELFGAAVPAVGVLDMLRFHKFTIGHAWRSEYGDPDSAADFRWLFAYSPLHNIRSDVQYPATLVMTSDHDDRVVPAHSFKFAARLQEAQTGENPILMRVERAAGHSVGRPLMKSLEEAADKLGFLFSRLR